MAKKKEEIKETKETKETKKVKEAEKPTEKKQVDTEEKVDSKPKKEDKKVSETLEKPVENKTKTMITGIITFILAVIGIIAIVFFIVTSITSAVKTSKAEKLAEYQKFLVPIVMNDPDSFDDLKNANMTQLIDASIWAILNDKVTTSEYKYEDGKMILPQADVEKQFKTFFGTEIEIKHQSISGSGYEFEYDSSKSAYKIPITGVEPMYTPKVIDMEKKSGSLVLTVAYLSGSEWEQDENGDMKAPSPGKYVKITLREKDDAYYISAIQDTDAPETA